MPQNGNNRESDTLGTVARAAVILRSLAEADDDVSIKSLSDQLRLVLIPGHSPGHVCVDLQSGGERALFTGDMMHHCAQVLQPDWSSCFCYDVKASAATRWRFFREHVNTDTLVIPTHFPGTTAGRIAPLGEAFEFKFLAP